MGGNGAKEMQIGNFSRDDKSKGGGWINNSHTKYIDENFLMKIYFSNEISYNKIQIVYVYK